MRISEWKGAEKKEVKGWLREQWEEREGEGAEGE